MSVPKEHSFNDLPGIWRLLLLLGVLWIVGRLHCLSICCRSTSITANLHHTHTHTCSMKCYKMACAVLLRIYTHSEALPKKYCNNLPCQQKESIRIIFGFIFKRGCVKFDTQRTILQNKSQNVLVSRDNLVTPS